jgi:biopolymer transport protein TolR
LSEINIIPLVDVMLVLLIIFMVAAPMMQKGVEVNLPVSRRADKMTNTDPLYVTVPASFRKDRRIQIGEEFVSVDVLAERMRQVMINRVDKQVFLRGDGAVQLQELMDVFGRLKEAGIEKVGIVAQERRAQR